MRVRGTGFVMLAFDLGYEIDLERAAQRLGVERSAEAFRHKRGTPEAAAEARRPLRFTRPCAALTLGTRADERRVTSAASLELALYPFGALSLSYALPLDGTLEDLVETSVLLYDNAELLRTARSAAEALLAELGDAVGQPFMSAAVEDYVIYRLELLDAPVAGNVDALETEQRELLARILRAERGALSLHEVENALEGRIAYAPDELVLVDWFGALLIGADMEDERRSRRDGRRRCKRAWRATGRAVTCACSTRMPSNGSVTRSAPIRGTPTNCTMRC